jgi:RIO-like serine/threonine protein kinase
VLNVMADGKTVEKAPRRFNMNFEWIAMEHHRLHLIEEWPDSPHKEAALAAIRSTLESLLRTHRVGDLPACEVCLSRPNGPTLVDFPQSFQIEQDRIDLAA